MKKNTQSSGFIGILWLWEKIIETSHTATQTKIV